jgi:hypothetical protein
VRAVAFLLLVTTPAAADDVRDATRSPGFVTLPIFDATSRIGIDGSVLHTSSAVPTESVVTTVGAHAQLVDPGTGLGLYVLAQDFTSQSSPAGWGEAGALYVVPGSALESADLRLVLHAGAETTIGHDGVAVAGGASILGRSDDFYWRVDGGTRIAGAAPRLLFDAGAGYQLSPLVVAAELSYGPLVGGVDFNINGQPPPTSRSFTAAASARLDLGGVQPYAALATTLDASQLSATAGVEMRR